jgi:hypothetical protein
VSRTSEASAEAALRAQGVTGDHLVSLAHKVATDELRRRGAYLGDRYQDLVAHLLVTGCRAAITYDPSRSGDGYSFMSFLYDILKLRVSDFFRSKGEGFTDRRYAGADLSIVPVGDRVDALAAAGDQANGSLDPEDADLVSAAAALGEGLSDEARMTLELIVVAHASGVGMRDVQRATGISPTRQRRRLDALREEMEAGTSRRGR